nr:hypothetical protein [Methylobacterium sp.]
MSPRTAEHREGCGRAARRRSKPRRLGETQVEAAGRADVLRQPCGLRPRRETLPADRTAVEQAPSVPNAGDRGREPPLPPKVSRLVSGQAVRAELQPGCLPAAMPARRDVGAQRQQQRKGVDVAKGETGDEVGRETCPAREISAHAPRRLKIEPT